MFSLLEAATIGKVAVEAISEKETIDQSVESRVSTTTYSGKFIPSNHLSRRCLQMAGTRLE